MNTALTREIVRRIFGNLGIAPAPNFGQVGITLPEFCLPDQAVTLSYSSDEQQVHSVFAGILNIEKSQLRCLLIDLCIKDAAEYAAILQLDSSIIYGLKLVYDEVDNGQILTSSPANGWLEASVQAQAQLLYGVELLTSYGVGWRPCGQIDDLHPVLLTLL